MREVACFCHGALDGPLTLIEEGVQIIDQRLHFRSVIAAETRFNAMVDGRQTLAQLGDTGQPAANLKRAAGHDDDRGHDKEECVRRPDEVNRPAFAEHREIGRKVEDRGNDDEGQQHQADGPQNGAKQDPRAQRESHAPPSPGRSAAPSR